VNKVWYLDATRSEVDVYNMAGSATWRLGPPTRSAAAGSGPTPRRRPRAAHPGAQDGRQGDQGGGREEHGPRADQLLAGLETEPGRRPGGRIRFPARRRAAAPRSPRRA
jgi:hypothetical protein